eukprot:g1652.t1
MSQGYHEITREENISAQLNLQDLCSDIRKLVNEKNTMREQNIEYAMKLQKEKEFYYNMKSDYEHRIKSAENERNATENGLYVEIQKNAETVEMKAHLQKQNQILVKRVEDLNDINLKLKLQLQQLSINTSMNVENDNVKIQCDRISSLINILMAETTSINKRIDQTRKLTQVLSNEHNNIKHRHSKTNTLYLKQKQKIEEMETIIRKNNNEVSRLQNLQLETKRDRDNSKLLNESLKQQIEQKDRIIEKFQSEINNNKEMLTYFMEMHKKHCNSQEKLKDLLYKYEDDLLKLKELHTKDANIIALKIKDMQELEEKYEQKFDTMQIEAVLKDIINKIVYEQGC